MSIVPPFPRRGGSGASLGSSNNNPVSVEKTDNDVPTGQQSVQFGRDGKNVPNDFHMPAFGIEDIDRAVFTLFDKDIALQVTYQGNTTKVPVIFASGERFALTRRDSPIRDSNNALILPVVSILRENIDFSPNQGGYSTAIAYRNQTEYYVKKRLAESDRDYQNIINKMHLKNQDNVATTGHFIDTSDISPGAIARADTIASRRNRGNLSFLDRAGKVGIESNLGNNIFEIIQMVYPTFVTITYNVTFWVQYIQQANQVMEMLLASLDQKNQIGLTTAKGYELVIFFDETFSQHNNFDDFSDTERIIKYSFNVNVPGYIVANQPEGESSPFKSFYSAPQIDFGYYDTHDQVIKREGQEYSKKNNDRFILNEVSSEADIDPHYLERGQSSEEVAYFVEDPFSGTSKLKYGRVKLRNQRAGETVVGPAIVKKIDNQSE